MYVRLSALFGPPSGRGGLCLAGREAILDPSAPAAVLISALMAPLQLAGDVGCALAVRADGARGSGTRTTKYPLPQAVVWVGPETLFGRFSDRPDGDVQV